MSVLEKVVRPLQTGLEPRRIPVEQTRAVEHVVLRAGRTGSGKTLSGSAAESMTFYCEAHENEARQPLRADEGLKKTTRKTHVRRFWGKDENGNKIDEVWVDVQRIDELEVTSQPGAQKLTYHVKWSDPDDEAEDNPKRKIKKIKIFNPDDDTQFVEVPAVERADWIARPYITRPNIQKPTIVGGEGYIHRPFGFFNGQFWGEQEEKLHIKYPLDNNGRALESSRVGKVRIVEHRDVTVEPNDDGFFPDNNYKLPTDPSSIDDTQKVYFEFPTRVIFNSGSGVNEQKTYVNLRQDYLFELFPKTPPVRRP